MNTLVIFGRTPRPDIGKTRLRAVLGATAVDDLLAAFTTDVVTWLLPSETSLVVALTEPTNGLAELVPSATFAPQPDATFGERIASAFDSAFQAGAHRVVIVGTDAPTLPATHIAACFDGLNTRQATLIPADDGGWIALGLTRPLGTVLNEVPWSTSETCDRTALALAQDDRSPLLLAPWYDVDDAVGFDRLRKDVTDPVAAARAPRTAALLADWFP